QEMRHLSSVLLYAVPFCSLSADWYRSSRAATSFSADSVCWESAQLRRQSLISSDESWAFQSVRNRLCGVISRGLRGFKSVYPWLIQSSHATPSVDCCLVVWSYVSPGRNASCQSKFDDL